MQHFRINLGAASVYGLPVVVWRLIAVQLVIMFAACLVYLMFPMLALGKGVAVRDEKLQDDAIAIFQ